MNIWKYRARIRPDYPAINFHDVWTAEPDYLNQLSKLHNHLTLLFCDTSVEVWKCQEGWICIDMDGTKEQCCDVKKVVRRLQRGKPQLVVFNQWMVDPTGAWSSMVNSAQEQI